MVKKRLVIINISNIGDIVSCLSVVKLLSEHYRIDFYTKEIFRELLTSESYINVVNYTDLIQNNYSILLDMTSSSASRKIVKNVEYAKKKYGMYTSIFSLIKQKFFYEQVIKKNKHNHIVRNYYTFLEFFPKITTENIEKFPVMEMDQAISIELKHDFISIHIGARNPIRATPFKLLQNIIEYINSNYEIDIYLLGDDNAKINKLLQQYPFLKHQVTDLNLLKVFIGNSKLFIGPDSGLLHIASFLDVPSIGIYGPNIKEVCGPLNNKTSIIDKNFSCRPCNQNKKCPYEIKCLNSIVFDSEFKTLVKRKLTNTKRIN